MDSLRHSSQAPNNPHDGSEPHTRDMTKQTTTDTGESGAGAGLVPSLCEGDNTVISAASDTVLLYLPIRKKLRCHPVLSD